MNGSDIKKWLDDNFEDFEEYIVEIKTPENERKEFLVVAEVPQQLKGAVYEFTRNGGEFVSAERVNLSPDSILAGSIDSLIKPFDALIVSEHLFEAKIDIPLVLDLPDPSKTDLEAFYKRFEDYARNEGLSSYAEEYDSSNKPNGLSKDALESIMGYYKDAISESARAPEIPFSVLMNARAAEYFQEFKEKNDLHDAYGDVFYSDECSLRDYANEVDEKLADLGLSTDLHFRMHDAFVEGCSMQDKSQALDWLDQDVMVNFHPTVDRDDYEDGVMCSSHSGDAYRVIPDEAFQAALTFFNISAEEYEDCLTEMSGGNFVLSRDNAEWFDVKSKFGSLNAWCPKSDIKKGFLVTPKNLVELIENTNGGDTPSVLTWTVNVNLKNLVSVPPGQTVSLSGGQIGFHDYANGSGHMEGYAERAQDIPVASINWTPDDLRRYGVDAVYGMTHSATDGDLTWSNEAKAKYLADCYQKRVDYLRDRGMIPTSTSDLTVNEDGFSMITGANGKTARLVDEVATMKLLYGKGEDLYAPYLNETDKKDLGITEPTTSLDPR